MSKIAAATEAVKEAVSEPIQVSAQTKARFSSHAVKDESGELYLGLDQFVDAVAPKGEDFVSQPRTLPSRATPCTASSDIIFLSFFCLRMSN